jgi:hypothetical protein
MINILDAGNRYKAAGMHFGLSMGVAILAALVVFGLWYPWPYRQMSGGQQLFLMIVSIDLILGPLLTLAVFTPRKRRKVMFGDLVVIVALQLCALAYGLHIVHVARPVALVFEGERFRTVSDNDVVHKELPNALVAVKNLSLSGPVVLGTRVPANEIEKIKSIEWAMEGIDIGRRPSFWQPYSQSVAAALAKARPLSALYKQYPASRTIIDEAAARSGRKPEQLKFLPVVSMRGDWSALLDAQSGDVVGFVPIEGFF